MASKINVELPNCLIKILLLNYFKMGGKKQSFYYSLCIAMVLSWWNRKPKLFHGSSIRGLTQRLFLVVYVWVNHLELFGFWITWKGSAQHLILSETWPSEDSSSPSNIGIFESYFSLTIKPLIFFISLACGSTFALDICLVFFLVFDAITEQNLRKMTLPIKQRRRVLE